MTSPRPGEGRVVGKVVIGESIRYLASRARQLACGELRVKVHRSDILQVRYDNITQTGSDPIRSLSQYASRTSRVPVALCVCVHYVNSCLKRWRSGSVDATGYPICPRLS